MSRVTKQEIKQLKTDLGCLKRRTETVSTFSLSSFIEDVSPSLCKRLKLSQLIAAAEGEGIKVVIS